MPDRKSDDVALSDKLAKAATSEGKAQRIIYDGGKRAVRGFGLRVTTAGAKSFILTYWNAEGRQRRYTIGAYPESPHGRAAPPHSRFSGRRLGR